MGVSRQKFNSLELARGIAAILVLFYHIDKYYFASPKYYVAGIFFGAFKFGHAGVEFFFVLSGFIMIWSHWLDFGQIGKVAAFAKKRIIRIYPLVWFSTLAMVAMYLAMPGAGKAIYRTPLLIAESLALVGRNPLNAIDFPSWTLWHENVFYGFCALIIWRPRLGGVMLATWAVVCIAIGFSRFRAETEFYPLAPINALFFCGAGLAVLLMRYRLRAAGPALVGGLLAFFAFGALCDLYPIDERVQHAAFGLSAAMVVGGAVELERSGRLALPRWAATAGILSFPLYLTHMFVLPIAAKGLVATHLTRVAPPVVGFAILVGASVGAAMIVHKLVEQPATRLLRKTLMNAARAERTVIPDEAGLA